MILRGDRINPDAFRQINGNLEVLPFGNGSFDVVMPRGVIQHTSNPNQAFKELLRVWPLAFNAPFC